MPSHRDMVRHTEAFDYPVNDHSGGGKSQHGRLQERTLIKTSRFRDIVTSHCATGTSHHFDPYGGWSHGNWRQTPLIRLSRQAWYLGDRMRDASLTIEWPVELPYPLP